MALRICRFPHRSRSRIHPTVSLDPQAAITESSWSHVLLLKNPYISPRSPGDRKWRAVGVTQARLRKNPSLTAGGLQELDGQDNRVSIGGGFRSNSSDAGQPVTEVAVAQLEVHSRSVADRERLFDREVGMRFRRDFGRGALIELRRAASSDQSRLPKLMQDRVRRGIDSSLDADEVRVEVGPHRRPEDRIIRRRGDHSSQAQGSRRMQPDEILRLKIGLTSRKHQLTRTSFPDRTGSSARPRRGTRERGIAEADLRQNSRRKRSLMRLSRPVTTPQTLAFSQRAFDAAGNLSPISPKPLTTLLRESKLPCRHSTATKAHIMPIQRHRRRAEPDCAAGPRRSLRGCTEPVPLPGCFKRGSPPTAAASRAGCTEPRCGSPDLQLWQDSPCSMS